MVRALWRVARRARVAVISARRRASSQSSAAPVISAMRVSAARVSRPVIARSVRRRIMSSSRCTCSLRAIQSGQDGFDDWAQIQIGARLPVTVSPDDWYSILKEMAGEAELERIGFAIPAYQCEKNTALVRAFLAGIRAEGGKPSFVYKTGTADLNVVGPVWNCPALVYGPGDSALDHTPEEHLELDEYARAVGVLVASLQSLISVYIQ